MKRVQRDTLGWTDYLNYDALGRVLSMKQGIVGAPASAYGPEYSLDYQYFANGAVKEMTYPAVTGGARRVVRHELDSVGRTVKTCNGNCAVDVYAEIAGATAGVSGYTAHGAVGRMVYGNDVVETNGYNSLLQWETQNVAKSGGVNFGLTLGYGSVAGKNNGTVLSQRIVSGSLDVTQAYTYTQRNQRNQSHHDCALMTSRASSEAWKCISGSK